MIVGLIILFFLCVGLAAFNNAAQIRLMTKQTSKDQNIWHITSAAIRGVLTLVILYQAFDCSIHTVKLWILTQLFWWIFFDELLNLLRGRMILYVGYTDVVDKSIRAIAGKLKLAPELTGILIKLICVILTLLI